MFFNPLSQAKFMLNKPLLLFIVFLLSISLSSALTINSIESPTLSPSQEGTIRIELENNLDQDIQDVSISLKFTDLPLNPVGISSDSIDEITEDDYEVFSFKVQSSPTAKPDDYEIPYTLQYTYNGNIKTEQGTIGIQIKANPSLAYSIETKSHSHCHHNRRLFVLNTALTAGMP